MSKKLLLAGVICSVLTAACIVWALVGVADAHPLRYMLAALLAVCGLSLALMGQCLGRIETLEARLSGIGLEPVACASSNSQPQASVSSLAQAATISLLGVTSMLTTLNVAIMASRPPAIPPVPPTQSPSPGTTSAEWWKSAIPIQKAGEGPKPSTVSPVITLPPSAAPIQPEGLKPENKDTGNR